MSSLAPPIFLTDPLYIRDFEPRRKIYLLALSDKFLILQYASEVMVVIDHNVSEPCFSKKKKNKVTLNPQLRNQEKVSTKLQLTHVAVQRTTHPKISFKVRSMQYTRNIHRVTSRVF